MIDGLNVKKRGRPKIDKDKYKEVEEDLIRQDNIVHAKVSNCFILRQPVNRMIVMI